MPRNWDCKSTQTGLTVFRDGGAAHKPNFHLSDKPFVVRARKVANLIAHKHFLLGTGSARAEVRNQRPVFSGAPPFIRPNTPGSKKAR